MTRNILSMAPPYEPEDAEHIRAQFSSILGHDISFERVEEDKSLIGGFRAVIDGLVYDASLAGQFGALRETARNSAAAD